MVALEIIFLLLCYFSSGIFHSTNSFTLVALSFIWVRVIQTQFLLNRHPPGFHWCLIEVFQHFKISHIRLYVGHLS